MGCFFGCFRSKDKESPCGVHFSTTTPHTKSRVKYLKSCGTLLRTPSEIREASGRHQVSSEDEKNLGSDWHSWFPPPPHPVAENSKVDWDGKPNQVPTPPAHLHEELCKMPTPDLPLHVPKQLPTRFVNGKQDALHLEGKEVERPPRLKQYDEIAEEESDSFSDTRSFASPDSAVRNENQRSKVFDSPARDEPQTPLLFKSNYSPQPTPSKGEPQTPSLFKSNYSPQHTAPRYEPQTPPLFISHYSPHSTPLKLTDDMHTPWIGCPKVLENAGVNKNARLRSQYVYSVLNPVENLSQWKALKKGNSKETVEEKNHPWGEGSVENQSAIALQAQITPTSNQRIESPGAVTDSGIPKVPCYSSSRLDYRAKENFPSDEEIKFTEENLDVIDESGQKRKLIAASPEPFFKLPKSSGHSNLITEQSPPGALQVDSSLSHWVKPTATVVESKAGWFPSTDTSVETQNLEVASSHKSFPSTSSTEVLQMQSSQSSKNMDDRPVLGVLSTFHRQSASPGRSPSNKSGDDDRPILGTVAAHWNDNQSASPKWWDGKGIPNSTNKYKEDQKVSWHSTPFEERLEKALSNEGVVSQRKLFNGKPVEFGESEESDTAAS